MTGIFESTDRSPVTYLLTGDHALIVAWYMSTDGLPYVVLCLEDGTAVGTLLSNVKFDYRWVEKTQKWVDVSRIHEDMEAEDAEPNQAPADHGGPSVP